MRQRDAFLIREAGKSSSASYNMCENRLHKLTAQSRVSMLNTKSG